MQAIVGDILQALEAKGIYQVAPAGFPCSIVFVNALGDWGYLSHSQRVNPAITYIHVMTDEAMLSLLQQWSEKNWRDYLRGRVFGMGLTEQVAVAVLANRIYRPSEHLDMRDGGPTAPGSQMQRNFRYGYSVQDGEPDVLQCCGFFWDYVFRTSW